MQRTRLVSWIVPLLGALVALLMARLLLSLFAARPDNTAVLLVDIMTWPLVAPFAWLDANQPQFGAVLQFSTLAAIAVLGLVTLVVLGVARRKLATSR